MVARAIICIDDATSHGGRVIQCDPGFVVMGKPAARVGHLTHCPKCGGKNYPIIDGDPNHMLHGQPLAVHGMLTACGAKLIASQFTDTVDVGIGDDQRAKPSSTSKARKSIFDGPGGVPPGKTHFDNSDLATIRPRGIYTRATPAGVAAPVAQVPKTFANVEPGTLKGGTPSRADLLSAGNNTIDQMTDVLRNTPVSADREAVSTRLNALGSIGNAATDLENQVGVDRSISLNRAGYTLESWRDAHEALSEQYRKLVEAEELPYRAQINSEDTGQRYR